MSDPIAAAIARQDERAERCFESLEGRYRLSIADAGVTLEVDFLRREAHQLKGELLVRCELPGARTFDGVLAIGDLNLSSTRAREAHAKYLADRSQAQDMDWTGLLEELSPAGARGRARRTTGRHTRHAPAARR